MANFRTVTPELVEARLKSAAAAVTPVADKVMTVSVSYTLDPFGKEAETVRGWEADCSTTAVCTPVSEEASTPKLMVAGPVSLSESMVMASPVTDRPARSAVPDTVMVSETTSATLSSAMVKLKVPDPLVWPAEMVTLKELLAWSVLKSDDSALPVVPSPVTVTVMAVSDSKVLDPDGRAALTVAVTAASPSPIVS